MVRPRPRRNVYEAPFWDFVTERTLRLQRCLACGRLRYPPAGVCPDCLSEESEWQPVSGRGRLLSWVVFHRQYFPELPIPYTVAAVELEEGPILITNLVGPAAPYLDAPVLVTYEDTVDSAGEPWVIYQFQLAGTGTPAC